MTDQATPDRPQFVYEPDASAGSFVMLIAKENTPTVDGRMFTSGSIDWRELPIPLTLNRINSAEGQHKTATGVGMVTEVWKDGSDVYGKGYFSADEAGQEARALIKEGVIAHVSADVAGVTSEELSAGVEYPEGVRKVLTKGTIIGVTALLHSSFNETKIAVDESPILAAGGEVWEPRPELFDNPNLTGPTPLTITADGHVFGHAALWGTCHVGYKDRCVQPPHSASNYSYFSTGTVLTAGGKARRVGRITADTGHAPIEFAAAPAVAHYDHTGFGAAFVASGEDEFGIWYSGAVAPTATPVQVANMRAAGVSGDWRSISGSLEMIGLLAVNTPGYPIPRSASSDMSIIAAGMILPEEFKADCGCDGQAEDDCEDCKKEATLAADEFDMPEEPVNWASDLDRTFLASVRSQMMDTQETLRRATEAGTPLNTSVQSYAAQLISHIDEQVQFIDRSIGLNNKAEDDDNDEPVAPFEAEDVARATTLSASARIAILDADLMVFARP